MTTLGYLKYYGSTKFAWFEWHYLTFLHKCLTEDWLELQSGTSAQTMSNIITIFEVLELDRKARVDMMLLYHTGIVGRTLANELMWELLSTWATDPRYLDLSRKVSHECGRARRSFERPPFMHNDMHWWSWECLQLPYWQLMHWSPSAVPQREFDLVMESNGMPVRPPNCWVFTF